MFGLWCSVLGAASDPSLTDLASNGLVGVLVLYLISTNRTLIGEFRQSIDKLTKAIEQLNGRGGVGEADEEEVLPKPRRTRRSG